MATFQVCVLFLVLVAVCNSANTKIRLALVAPLGSNGVASIAGAKQALGSFSESIELLTVQANDTNPYQYSKDTAALLATSPILITGLVAATNRLGAASAVAAEAYYQKHAFVSVGAFDLNLNVGSSSGLRVTPSAESMGIAMAGTLQHFGFQQFTVLASTQYAAVSTVLLKKMKEHFELENGGLDESAAASGLSYIFDSGTSTTSAAEMTAALQKIQRKTARVVVLLCSKEDAKLVLPLANELNMMKKGYVWAGLGWLDDDFLESNVVPKTALVGTLGLIPAPWKNLSEQSEFSGETSTFYSYTHDAMLALATASVETQKLYPALDPSKDMAFCKLVEKYALTHQVVGQTGTVSFDHDQDVDDVEGDPLNDRGNREAPPFSVLNVGLLGESTKEVYLLSGANGKVLGTSDAHVHEYIVWPGGIESNLPPSDRSVVELGPQSWYIVVALLFVAIGYLGSGEGTRRGCPSVFQESLVIITLGIFAGLLLRAGNDEELIAVAIFDETVFTFILLPIIIFESGRVYNCCCYGCYLNTQICTQICSQILTHTHTHTYFLYIPFFSLPMLFFL